MPINVIIICYELILFIIYFSYYFSWLFNPFRFFSTSAAQRYFCWLDLSIRFLTSHVVSWQLLRNSSCRFLMDCSELQVPPTLIFLSSYRLTNFRTQFFFRPPPCVSLLIPEWPDFSSQIFLSRVLVIVQDSQPYNRTDLVLELKTLIWEF